MSHKLYKSFEGKLHRASKMDNWLDVLVRIRTALDHELENNQLTQGEWDKLVRLSARVQDIKHEELAKS